MDTINNFYNAIEQMINDKLSKEATPLQMQVGVVSYIDVNGYPYVKICGRVSKASTTVSDLKSNDRVLILFDNTSRIIIGKILN